MIYYLHIFGKYFKPQKHLFNHESNLIEYLADFQQHPIFTQEDAREDWFKKPLQHKIVIFNDSYVTYTIDENSPLRDNKYLKANFYD